MGPRNTHSPFLQQFDGSSSPRKDANCFGLNTGELTLRSLADARTTASQESRGVHNTRKELLEKLLEREKS